MVTAINAPKVRFIVTKTVPAIYALAMRLMLARNTKSHNHVDVAVMPVKLML